MVFGALVVAGCGHQQRTLVYQSETALAAGRFRGPVEVKLPRRTQQPHRWVEIHTELVAACGPRLRLRYPDGEVARLGDENERWQALLAARAEHRSSSKEPGPDEGAAPANEPGHWERFQTESWPGQLEFLRARKIRCKQRRTYRRVHVTALDQIRPLALWSDVPQELADARLEIKVYEVVDVGAIRDDAEAEAEAEVVDVKPRPPRPKPKREKHGKPEVAGARWVPGHWEWREGDGAAWFWIRGYWQSPGEAPPPEREDPGAPPIAGCAWARGHWVWVSDRGGWDWVAGHWNPPPPRVEDRGALPVPESTWIAGRWVRAGATFRWIAGRWGKPRPRDETPPPRPGAGAVWRPGVWLKIRGKWVWSPGSWDSGRKPPPPLRAETRGKRPHEDAVWLAGFWRWRDGRYRWVTGRWELPPGEGYVWVPDPANPKSSGRWVLKVKVRP